MKTTGIYEIEDLKLDGNSLMVNEAVFHNANGYLGVRSNFEEGYKDGFDTIRGTYINGFYDFADMKQAEKLYGLTEEKQTIVNVVDTQTIVVELEGERFSMFEGTVLKSSRLLNMEEGYTQRSVLWRSPGGKEVEIVVRRMTSFVRKELFLIDYKIKSINFSGKVTIYSKHKGDVLNYFNPGDPRVAGESFVHLIPESLDILQDRTYVVTNTSKSELSVTSGVTHRLFTRNREGIEKELHHVKVDIHPEGHGAEYIIQGNITQGEELSLRKYTILSDSIRHAHPKEACTLQVKQVLEDILSLPVEKLYAEQKRYLDEYWENAYLKIKGDDELSQAVKYNMYQLVQSVSKDSFGNIAAKGLSGEGYEGHFFWDTEMYIQPFFTLTDPQITKSLIGYRYTILDEARKNARIMGHEKGALYPWRTIMGKECSGYFPSGTAQYHINGDIAYSISAYYLATKDLEFIREKGAEILFETARLWMDTGTYQDGRFVIHEVTGPDEYTCLVNNNYYTNASAKNNLYWAVKFYGMLKNLGQVQEIIDKIDLKESEIMEFQEAEASMYLPYDEDLKINPQDDSFLSKKVWDLENTPKDKFPLLLHYHPLYIYRHQVCKQADTVLAHFIFEDYESLETIRNSFLYYERVTTHDSSLSTCIYSIMASKLGLKDKAYMYFGDSAKLDLMDAHKNTKDGIHTANMGGNYMAIVYGFGGVRIKESGLYMSPYLPKYWEEYEFKMHYQGGKILVKVERGLLTVELVEGDKTHVNLYGKEYELVKQVPVTLHMKYKAIIFDLDGVICHTDRYHYLAWKEIADSINVYFDEEINERLRGVSRMESLEIILERYQGELTKEEKDHYAAAKNDIYRKLLNTMTPDDLSDEVKETLDQLRARGLKLAIGSSSKNARLILKQIGLENYFDAISDGNNITKSKPDKEVFVKASQYINIKPQECLVVEDAKAGIEAAIAGGMDCAVIGGAAKSGLATYPLETFSDILKCL